jgi:hypothetical protein
LAGYLRHFCGAPRLGGLKEEKTFNVAEHSLLKKEPSLLNLGNVDAV